MLDLNIKYRKNILKFYFINSSSKELKREFYNDLNYNSNTKRIIDLTISLFLENDYDSENIVRFIFNELVENSFEKKEKINKNEFESLKKILANCQKYFYLDIIKEYKYDNEYRSYYEKLNNSDILLFKFLNYQEFNNNKNLIFFSSLLVSDEDNKKTLTNSERLMTSKLIESNILNDKNFIEYINNNSL